VCVAGEGREMAELVRDQAVRGEDGSGGHVRGGATQQASKTLPVAPLDIIRGTRVEIVFRETCNRLRREAPNEADFYVGEAYAWIENATAEGYLQFHRAKKTKLQEFLFAFEEHAGLRHLADVAPKSTGLSRDERVHLRCLKSGYVDHLPDICSYCQGRCAIEEGKLVCRDCGTVNDKLCLETGIGEREHLSVSTPSQYKRINHLQVTGFFGRSTCTAPRPRPPRMSRPISTLLLEAAALAAAVAFLSDVAMSAYVAAHARLRPDSPIHYATAGWMSVGVAAASAHLLLEVFGANRAWCRAAFGPPRR